MTAFCLSFVFALALFVSPVFAATKTAAAPAGAEPSPMTNPVLAGIIQGGAKAYYMGSRSGLDGWFVLKDGQMQIVYSTPDHQAVLIGAMFSKDENITGDQVKNLLSTNKEVASFLMGAAQEQAAINKVGGGAATSNAPLNASTPTATNIGGLPAVTVSPGEKLVQELNGASGVTLGKGPNTLLMVMDPNCPHCQATWKMLRDAVMKNQISLHMIPIATADTDNERAAAILLKSADPLTVWDKYVGGDKAQLAGTPDPAMVTAVRANHELTDRWNIHVTPYLVYRGHDGKVKILQGEPEQVSAVLNDLGP
jgi:protein-disulfide isomerase